MKKILKYLFGRKSEFHAQLLENHSLKPSGPSLTVVLGSVAKTLATLIGSGEHAMVCLPPKVSPWGGSAAVA